jgi:hypothetical protein
MRLKCIFPVKKQRKNWHEICFENKHRRDGND